jgi:hypothetical protein
VQWYLRHAAWFVHAAIAACGFVLMLLGIFGGAASTVIVGGALALSQAIIAHNRRQHRDEPPAPLTPASRWLAGALIVVGGVAVIASVVIALSR